MIIKKIQPKYMNKYCTRQYKTLCPHRSPFKPSLTRKKYSKLNTTVKDPDKAKIL